MGAKDKAKEIRTWFTLGGEMDFDFDAKKLEGKTGKYIVYECAEIDKLFERVLGESDTSASILNIQNVSGCCTDGKHRRQITEKELKLAAKEMQLNTGLIEYIINKVRKMQVKSGNNR